ncbi:Zn-ribbon domain-containing OB-fold protein [Pseudobacillus badius]|uniref:Zn-ribbon domain-containing OB-fold protein n=1 Tax=Bacillus badius TaxID=1455 RepID=UPI0007B0A1A3|nr:OB-fold domain-containing protein [Bacillus badius]KZN99577.1 hypothetical protein A4244_16350 [Bacillus badius]MED0665903.1 OB-fold domain-containing protein [Bacillus badius]OCS85681.1 hypothetical protein A6M11_16365 [Bacillus badius]OVE51965.1 hypothetical protein B1A98_10485 [Bacillus badius]TDW03401.1 hypothetical protein B0G66_104314 [Bacillus badius]
MGYEKPMPVKTIDNSPYWNGADQHELVLQKCKRCQSYAHPPGPACASCGNLELEWENLGSEITGKVFSYVVSYRPFLPGFQADLPLIIAQVTLDCAPEVKIIGNILKCGPQEVQIGLPVKMIWEDITEGRALPQWEQIS